jgi:hypothetical protein
MRRDSCLWKSEYNEIETKHFTRFRVKLIIGNEVPKQDQWNIAALCSVLRQPLPRDLPHLPPQPCQPIVHWLLVLAMQHVDAAHST